MRIADDTITFRFCFRGKSSKTESLLSLRSFLHEKEWLPEGSEYDADLMNYHTDNDGTCEVILRKVKGYDMEEVADIFLADLFKNQEIFYITVLYSPHTDKLVQTHAGKYLNRQKVDLSNLQELDEVIILYRK